MITDPKRKKELIRREKVKQLEMENILKQAAHY